VPSASGFPSENRAVAGLLRAAEGCTIHVLAVQSPPSFTGEKAVEPLAILVALLFSLLGVACLVLVVIGLPGTWILIGLAVAVELLDGHYLKDADPVTFGWGTIGACIGIAFVGEVIEALAGAAGTKAGGGSRRGMVGAIIGGLVGAILLTPLIPIPIVGTLIGALLGTFAGAVIAERSGPVRLDTQTALRAAGGATVGRLLGTVSKAVIATTIWVVLCIGAFWQ
jgi:uncharacterized protein YqgC (DUF456 family)